MGVHNINANTAAFLDLHEGIETPAIKSNISRYMNVRALFRCTPWAALPQCINCTGAMHY